MRVGTHLPPTRAVLVATHRLMLNFMNNLPEVAPDYVPICAQNLFPFEIKVTATLEQKVMSKNLPLVGICRLGEVEELASLKGFLLQGSWPLYTGKIMCSTIEKTYGNPMTE